MTENNKTPAPKRCNFCGQPTSRVIVKATHPRKVDLDFYADYCDECERHDAEIID